jgi:hypothetical protein
MNDREYFELTDGLDIVRIDSFKRLYPDAVLDYDKNCLGGKVSVQGGAFRGQFDAQFMTVDFENFKQELERLYNELNGYANFNCLENYLVLKIKGDGIGHFSTEIEANDNFSKSKLEFQMTFDQTQIPGLIRQLDVIIKSF